VTDLPISNSAELSAHELERVTIRGVYTVQDLGGHTIRIEDDQGGWRTVNRIALVRLADDEYVELVDRPEDEMDALDGTDVIAEGLLFRPASGEDDSVAAAEPLPTLTSIIRVEAAGS
jgi:hypothetical protein